MLILANGWASVSRATPLWLSRSCITRLSSRGKLLSSSSAQFADAAVLVCICRPSSTLAVVLRRSDAVCLFALCLAALNSVIVQSAFGQVPPSLRRTSHARLTHLVAGTCHAVRLIFRLQSSRQPSRDQRFPPGVLVTLVLDSSRLGDLCGLVLLIFTLTLVVRCRTDVGFKAW